MGFEAIDRDPVLSAVFDYWNSQRQGAAAPDRSAVDPLRMPRSVLPHLLLVELEGQPPRIRYRLVGTAIAARYGEDFTGRYLDEVSGPDYRQLLERLYAVMQQRVRPVYVESSFTLESESVARTSRLYLPLMLDGVVRQALAVQTFPAYPGDERHFFRMIRTGPGGDEGGGADGTGPAISHGEWLVDPDTRSMESLAPASGAV